MNTSLPVWLVTLLFSVLITLVAAIWRRTERRLDALEAKLDTSQLAQFKAFDAEREKHWNSWRERTDLLWQRQEDWRHEVLSPLLRQLGSDVDKLKEWRQITDRK